MSLKEAIQGDLQKALKTGENLRISVLRLLCSSILNKEKEKRYKSGKNEDILLSDEEILEVIMSEAKKRKEAMALYQKGGRPELADQEESELGILKGYLPEQLSEDELRKLVKGALEKTGAKEIKEMGKVMGVLMPQIKGRADGDVISKIVKELLTPEK